MLIFVGVVLLLLLVITHELGHFYAARKSGVEVEEFGIGFPPKAKSLGVKNGTEYTLNWLPLGGFVKLKGEHDSDTTKGSFGSATLKNKIYIMLAGVVVNALTAVFLLTIIALVGLPKVLDNQFTVASDTKIVRQDVLTGFVAKDSPAEVSGMKVGDSIISIADNNYGCEECLEPTDSSLTEINQSSDLSVATKKYQGREVVISVIRENENLLLNSKLLSSQEVEESALASEACLAQTQAVAEDCPSTKGYLGVIPTDSIARRSTWSAPIVAVVFSGQVIQETFSQFGHIIGDLFKGDTSTAKENVTGVVGIGYILGELSKQGFMSILFLTAMISLSLAIMNFLPIPALDGGRLFVTLLFRGLKRPLTKETEERIHGTGFMLLMVLFLLITVVDVQRFILK